MDWDAVNGSAAWAALLLTLWQIWRDHRASRARDQDLEADRLILEAEQAERDVLVLRLRYRPKGEHTRYRAEVRVVEPTQALVATADYISDHTHGVIMMPRPTWGRNAIGAKSWEDRLDYLGAPGELGVELAIKPAGERKAIVAVRIIDIADEREVVKIKRAISA